MKQEVANKLMNGFSDKLNELIGEYLVETDITKDNINEYYGYGGDCQISEMLEEERAFQLSLRE